MLFLRSPPYSWWFVFCKKPTKMADYLMNLESWLEDASLFRNNEPLDYAINFDDLLNEKPNTEEFQTTLSLPDMGWFDQKVDLSVFDNPDVLLDHSDDTEKLMDNDAAILLGLIDSGLYSSYLTSDSSKITELDNDPNAEKIIEPIISSDVLDTHLASPGCTTLQVNSPAFFPAQSPVSPYSDVSETPEKEAAVQLETSSITSDSANVSDFSVVQVSVYEDVSSPISSSDEVMSLEEVSQSVRKRKFVSDGDEDYIPKVKIVFKDLPKTSSKDPKPKDRRERKKMQNKEAAARYRIKKRLEDKELSDEICGLESTQKELKEKHDSLQSEIKYLKNLMCEILQKKGLLK